MAARRRPARGGIGSNQYKTRGQPRTAPPSTRIAAFATPQPAPPVSAIDTLAQVAVDRYRQLVASEGGDPDAELVTVRLTGGCTVAEWVGWRLVCHRYGEGPNDPGPVDRLEDWMISTMIQHDDAFDNVPEIALRLTYVGLNDRAAHAMDENTPPEVLVGLASDENSLVRARVAQNVRTPPAALHALLDDPAPAVRQRLLKNASTPAETLDRLADDPGLSGALNHLIEHPNTPDATLRRLAGHRERWVRESAGARLADRARRPHP